MDRHDCSDRWPPQECLQARLLEEGRPLWSFFAFLTNHVSIILIRRSSLSRVSSCTQALNCASSCAKSAGAVRGGSGVPWASCSKVCNRNSPSRRAFSSGANLVGLLHEQLRPTNFLSQCTNALLWPLDEELCPFDAILHGKHLRLQPGLTQRFLETGHRWIALAQSHDGSLQLRNPNPRLCHNLVWVPRKHGLDRLLVVGCCWLLLVGGCCRWSVVASGCYWLLLVLVVASGC